MTTDSLPKTPAEPTEAATSAGPKLWRNGNYQLLMGGRTLAIVGANMTGLAMMLVTYDLTHNAATASIVMAFGLVGQLLIGLPAGAYVDRWDRKTTMVVSALLNGLVVLTVPVAIWMHMLTVAHLAIVCFLSGGLASFYGPAEQAAVKKIVRPEQLGAAMTVNQSRGAIGSLAGPPIAGVLYGIGHAWPFLGEAVGEMASALCAFFVRGDLNPAAEERPERKKVGTEIADGLRYVFGHRVLAPTAYLACLLNFGFNAVITAVTLNLRATGTTAAQLGLMNMYIGISTIIGATLVAALLLKWLPVGKLLLAAFALSVAVISLLLRWHGYWAVVVVLVVLTMLLPAINAGVLGYFTAIVPDHLQGRAGSAVGVLSMGLMPLAQMGAGFLLEHLGVQAAIVAGLVPAVVAALMSLLIPALRSIPKTSEFGALAEDVVGR